MSRAADVGHGLTFTFGRGNDLCVAAVKSLVPLIQGTTLESITADMAGFWRHITGDSQFRWLGPEKGVIHLATAAIVNAVWDLWAQAEGKPLWKLLADMTPEQLVACVDFRYITDAITPAEATRFCRQIDATKPQREADASRRLSRVHDVGRLARIRRREAPPALPATACARGSRTSR